MKSEEYDKLRENIGVFYNEFEEQICEAEKALLRLEEDSSDEETLNTLFRAIHTIKGSASIFALNVIVGFAHAFESTLAKVRSYILPVNDQFIELAIECNDFMRQLMDADQNHEATQKEELERLTQALQTFERNHGVAVGDKNGSLYSKPVLSDSCDLQSHHLSIRFDPLFFVSGYSIETLVQKIEELGPIDKKYIIDELPPFSSMDPTHCYLGIELQIGATADIEGIKSLFDSMFLADPEFISPSDTEDALIHLYEYRFAELSEFPSFLQSFEIFPLIEAFAKSVSNNGCDAKNNYQKELAGDTPPGVNGQKLKKDNKEMIRVEAAKLDRLVNLVGELVMVNSRVYENALLHADSELIESVDEMATVLDSTRSEVMELRMVPLEESLFRFKRLVRDLSKKLNKQVNLEIVGGDTELDKSMMEQLIDPLTHMIRNAIDHGIESEEVRKQKNKSECATITINAYHQSNVIVIEIEDDGGGLDRDRILARAIENGLVQAESDLSDNKIYSLIFQAGFSTAQQTSDVSGRGVGMDVVKRNIEKLRGEVHVHSELNKGTKFTITLPLTLAIIEGFQVKVADADYIIPLDSIIECVGIDEREIASIEETGIIHSRGDALPVCWLSKFLNECKKPMPNNKEIPCRKEVVVVSYGNTCFGLVVDALLGEIQTVVKPLGMIFNHMKIFSGFTVLGAGNVALIFDITGLSRKINSTPYHPNVHDVWAHSSNANREHLP